MIRREAARPNGCREQRAIQSAHRSRSLRCPQRSLHKPRHRTSMPGSHETAPAGPRCRGSDGRHAPVGRKRELADHEADARGTPLQQIAIGMLNDVKCGDPVTAISWIKRAMRIDPVLASRYYLDLVRALFMAERSAEAIAVLERTTRKHHEHYLWLAACHAAAGNETAAHEAARKGDCLEVRLVDCGHFRRSAALEAGERQNPPGRCIATSKAAELTA
jgi:hypothetical protein